MASQESRLYRAVLPVAMSWWQDELRTRQPACLAACRLGSSLSSSPPGTPGLSPGRQPMEACQPAPNPAAQSGRPTLARQQAPPPPSHSSCPRR